MDPYDGSVLGAPADPRWEPIRRALGHARQLAERLNLAAMTPRDDITSTKYCLASPGREYLVYQPKAAEAFSVELKEGRYHFEWFDPAKGVTSERGRVESSGQGHRFKAPFEGDAVLYLKVQ
jgi:hypothetical protein